MTPRIISSSTLPPISPTFMTVTNTTTITIPTSSQSKPMMTHSTSMKGGLITILKKTQCYPAR
jgi:hypothetical protein